MNSFAKKLKELRTSHNLSQQALANIVGISKSSINMYERGEREPGLDTIGILSDFFDVETDYLLGKTLDKRSPSEAKKYNKLILKSLEDYRLPRGYDRIQMENLLDWDNMYDDLEQNKIKGDEGLLKTINGLLSINFSYKEQISPTGAISEGEKILLEVYRKASDDMKPILVNSIQALEQMPLDKLQFVAELLSK